MLWLELSTLEGGNKKTQTSGLAATLFFNRASESECVTSNLNFHELLASLESAKISLVVSSFPLYVPVFCWSADAKLPPLPQAFNRGQRELFAAELDVGHKHTVRPRTHLLAVQPLPEGGLYQVSVVGSVVAVAVKLSSHKEDNKT